MITGPLIFLILSNKLPAIDSVSRWCFRFKSFKLLKATLFNLCSWFRHLVIFDFIFVTCKNEQMKEWPFCIYSEELEWKGRAVELHWGVLNAMMVHLFQLQLVLEHQALAVWDKLFSFWHQYNNQRMNSHLSLTYVQLSDSVQGNPGAFCVS